MSIPARRLAGLAAFVMVSSMPALGLPSARAQNPQPPGVAEKLSSILKGFDENRTAEALEAADRFEREYADNPDALMQLAGLLAVHLQHERAAALYGRVNELRPHSPDILFNLGVALYHCRQLDKAAAALAESADLDERPADTHYSLAVIAAERDDHENAILELHHATERAPSRADYYALLGQEFFKVRYWQGAAGAYRHAAAIEPSEATHFLHLGDALLRFQDLKGAIDAFKHAERLDPQLPEINYLIGFGCETDSQLDQAREFYERQLALVPNHLASLLGAGTVALEQSRFQDGEKFLQAVLAHDSEHVQANYQLGLLWFKTKQYDRAIERFKRVLWLRPDHTQAEYYLYLALSRTHEDAAAEAALAEWKKLEALDRKVRSQEVAYEMARAAHWENAAVLPR